jgi:hypothetical protein
VKWCTDETLFVHIAPFDVSAQSDDEETVRADPETSITSH